MDTHTFNSLREQALVALRGGSDFVLLNKAGQAVTGVGSYGERVWSEMDWRETFQRLFVEAGGSCVRDDLLFCVFKRGCSDDGRPFVAIRRAGERMPPELCFGSPIHDSVDWRASVHLNLVMHTRYALTVCVGSPDYIRHAVLLPGLGACKEGAGVKRVTREVHPRLSKVSINEDCRAFRETTAQPACTYPAVHFSVDDFEDVFEDFTMGGAADEFGVALHALNGPVCAPTSPSPRADSAALGAQPPVAHPETPGQRPPSPAVPQSPHQAPQPGAGTTPASPPPPPAGSSGNQSLAEDARTAGPDPAAIHVPPWPSGDTAACMEQPAGPGGSDAAAPPTPPAAATPTCCAASSPGGPGGQPATAAAPGPTGPPGPRPGRLSPTTSTGADGAGSGSSLRTAPQAAAAGAAASPRHCPAAAGAVASEDQGVYYRTSAASVRLATCPLVFPSYVGGAGAGAGPGAALASGLGPVCDREFFGLLRPAASEYDSSALTMDWLVEDFPHWPLRPAGEPQRAGQQTDAQHEGGSNASHTSGPSAPTGTPPTAPRPAAAAAAWGGPRPPRPLGEATEPPEAQAPPKDLQHAPSATLGSAASGPDAATHAPAAAAPEPLAIPRPAGARGGAGSAAGDQDGARSGASHGAAASEAAPPAGPVPEEAEAGADDCVSTRLFFGCVGYEQVWEALRSSGVNTTLLGRPINCTQRVAMKGPRGRGAAETVVSLRFPAAADGARAAAGGGGRVGLSQLAGTTYKRLQGLLGGFQGPPPEMVCGIVSLELTVEELLAGLLGIDLDAVAASATAA